MINPTPETLLHSIIFKMKELENTVNILMRIAQEQNKAISILVSQQPKTINEVYQDDVKKAIYGGLH
jgi:hypothetical protein